MRMVGSMPDILTTYRGIAKYTIIERSNPMTTMLDRIHTGLRVAGQYNVYCYVQRGNGVARYLKG